MITIIEYIINKKTNEDFLIKYLTDIKQLINKIEKVNFNNNYIISGLNLAFLAFFYKKDIMVNGDFYLWPDGYFKKKFFAENIKKKPGRILFAELNLILNPISELEIHQPVVDDVFQANLGNLSLAHY